METAASSIPTVAAFFTHKHINVKFLLTWVAVSKRPLQIHIATPKNQITTNRSRDEVSYIIPLTQTPEHLTTGEKCHQHRHRHHLKAIRGESGRDIGVTGNVIEGEPSLDRSNERE